MDKEQFQKLMDKIKTSLGAENTAIVSNELAQVMSIYPASLDEVQKLKDEIEQLKKEKENLIVVNGQLLQKVGFDPKQNESDEVITEKAEDVISFDDVIDEKGDLID